MARAKLIEHVPCEACGSSDAGGLYTDGSCKCHKCGAKWKAEPDDPLVGGPEVVKGGVESSRGSSRGRDTGLLPFTVTALPARGITRDTCERWQYGWNKAQNAHVANYIDKSGRIVAQKVRLPDKQFYWTGNPASAGLYGEHLWRDGGKMLIVTEGEIDALSVSQAQGNKYPVASVPNGGPSAANDITKSLPWLESFDRVIFMFDEDEVGRAAAEECAALLTPGKAYIARLPLKDANELTKAGRSKDIIDAAWGAKAWRPSSIVMGDELLELMREGPEETVARWPFPKLDAMSLGLQRGNIALVVGGIGSGKTTLFKSIANGFLDQGLKVGVIPLEETIKQFGMGLLSCRLGRNVAIDESVKTLPPAFDKELQSLGDRLIFHKDGGDRRSVSIFDSVRYMALGQRCQIVMIDHLTIVVGSAADENDRRFAERFVLDLEALTKRTGIIAVVAAHLRKPGEGRSHEEGRRVTMSDIRGSGLIAATAHKIIAYERDQQDEDDGPPTGRIRFLKNRPIGRVGTADTLAFIEATGRLEVAEDKDRLPPVKDDPLQPVEAVAAPETY